MFSRGYYLGKICGIPIRADTSVFILVAWILLTFNRPFELRLFYAIGLLFSIVWHEMAHSLVAMSFGGKVRDITLQLMGGCASISEMPRRAWQEWVMALAGPLSSFVLAALAYIVMLFTKAHSLPESIFFALAFTNVMLGLFNLMPAFPMDGGRMLRAFLQGSMSKIRATWIASRVGRAIAIVFVVTGICNLLNIATSNTDGNTWIIEILGKRWEINDMNFFLNLFISFFTEGSWIKIIIGISIFQAAEMEYRMVLAQEANQHPRGFNPFQPPPRTDWSKPPPDDDRAIVSPPAYRKDKPDRVDIKRGE